MHKISLLRDSLLYGILLYGEAFNVPFNESWPGPLKNIVIEGYIVIPGIVVRRFHCVSKTISIDAFIVLRHTFSTSHFKFLFVLVV